MSNYYKQLKYKVDDKVLFFPKPQTVVCTKFLSQNPSGVFDSSPLFATVTAVFPEHFFYLYTVSFNIGGKLLTMPVCESELRLQDPQLLLFELQ